VIAEETQMVVNPEFNGSAGIQTRVVKLAPHELAGTPAPQSWAPMPPVAVDTTPSRKRSRRLAPAALAAVGMIVACSLGYYLFVTIGQRDAARHQLTANQATLATAKAELLAAQSDAAVKKLTADYVSLMVADDGAVQTSYQNLIACNGYSRCRAAAQQYESDLQAFQQARTSAHVPFAMSNTDGMFGDALSAAIAGAQELISGMDNGDMAKIKSGSNKVDAAMLSLAKAQTALGSGLR
jgi:hypothetical protein